MDLIKSGSCIDIFYAKTCATTKISTVAGYHVVIKNHALKKNRPFFKSKLGGGHLLEHGRLLECLRYITST